MSNCLTVTTPINLNVILEPQKDNKDNVQKGTQNYQEYISHYQGAATTVKQDIRCTVSKLEGNSDNSSTTYEKALK